MYACGMYQSIISYFCLDGQSAPTISTESREDCAICDEQTYDGNMHVLFECEKLENPRTQMLEKLTRSMPQALASDFMDMSNEEKAILMLSGYGHNYIPEWKELYVNTANLIDSLYKLRSCAYDNLPIDNG